MGGWWIIIKTFYRRILFLNSTREATESSSLDLFELNSSHISESFTVHALNGYWLGHFTWCFASNFYPLWNVYQIDYHSSCGHSHDFFYRVIQLLVIKVHHWVYWYCGVFVEKKCRLEKVMLMSKLERLSCLGSNISKGRRWAQLDSTLAGWNRPNFVIRLHCNPVSISRASNT